MIYSKFGTPLSLVSRTGGAGGRVWVQAAAGDGPDLHEYDAADLTADDGLQEINAAVAKLPPKNLQNNSGRRRKPL